MKPERAFVAERVLAQHCPELLRSSAAPIPLMPALTRLGDGLARTLSIALAPLSAGEAPLVRSQTPRECTMAELAQQIGPLAANSLLTAGSPDMPLLASVEAEAVLRMVDRAFGGRGEGNLGSLRAEPVRHAGRPASAIVHLPALSGIWLAPA